MDVVSFKSDLLDPNSDDGKKLLHFIETICLFCKKHDSHSLFEHPGFILILPYVSSSQFSLFDINIFFLNLALCHTNK